MYITFTLLKFYVYFEEDMKKLQLHHCSQYKETMDENHIPSELFLKPWH